MESRVLLLVLFAFAVSSDFTESPSFGEPIANVTVPLGREAMMTCVVNDLGTYKVAWLRVDTQTILTIHHHVITKNHRIGVSNTDERTWHLHIKELKESDRGWYMCQINTDPMKSQVGFLEVIVPPDILDSPTSADTVVREGGNVSLRCAASGIPMPNITWKREGGAPIPLTAGVEVFSVEGPTFNISRVNRLHMGPYMCIASNGVPPSVSKRIMLTVEFPPMIWIQSQLVAAYQGQRLVLECHSEAYPKSISYWTRERGEVITYGQKYEPVIIESDYRTHMKLIVKSVSASDYGNYKCVSKNSLGDTDGAIKVYPVLSPTGKQDIKFKFREKNRHKLSRNKTKNDIDDAEDGGGSKDKQSQYKEYEEYEDEFMVGSGGPACSKLFSLSSYWYLLLLPALIPAN
nr:PREDICTED: protein amalgam-like [Bemisia tabaci]